ncbi:MAG: hypothetical protein Q4P06_07830 [Actinomycetaceae bacterium]|nr:hypothetical protein [Actinomycetaceae bacterium]
MNFSFQQARPEQGSAVDFIGSAVVASSIALALSFDRFIGWGETRWSVLDSNVVLILLPVLAVWVVVAILEQMRGAGSRILLVVHCIAAFVPAIALAVMAQQGRIFSPGVSGLLENKTALSVGALESGFIVLAAVMGIVASVHAVATHLKTPVNRT